MTSTCHLLMIVDLNYEPQDHDSRKKGQKGKKNDSEHVMSATREEEHPDMLEIRGMLQKLTSAERWTLC